MTVKTDNNSKNIILKVNDISLEDNSKYILKNISFDIYQGDHVSIVGSSGSGKSTLLRILNRLIEPTSGTISFKSKNYTKLLPQELRQKIGLVLQSPFLFPGTVAQNIAFGPLQENRIFTKTKIDNLLKKVGLENYGQRDVKKLSGGEAQRVSLARTLANNPSILLLDEPTSALDKKSQAVVEKLLCEIANDTDLTCIIVTHNKEQAKRLTNRSIEIEQGEIKQIYKL